MMQATVIGAGLAGSEAAWQLACRGIEVRLLEMKPRQKSPAHKMDTFAELVCSNSFRSGELTNAAGLLKEELRRLGSLIVACADATQVDAGGALAVDRQAFSHLVTQRLRQHPRIHIEEERVDAIPESGHVIVATGPLTDGALAEEINALCGEPLSFYDAAAPVVMADSLDRSKVFSQSRYEDGGGDYLNAPFGKEEYERFMEELVAADRVIKREFETADLFQACQPIEEIARRGFDAPRFGPLKPVGLTDPTTGRRPWAVVQLRAEDAHGQSFNLVGFQTNLTFPEQKRVFRMIPGLENAEFARYGVMHRNSFIDAPQMLSRTLQLSTEAAHALPVPIFVAGQFGGTEGYCEAIASGLYAALSVSAQLNGEDAPLLPEETAFGALIAYATNPETRDYQPMHVNFGIMKPFEKKIRNKRERYAAYASRGDEKLRGYVEALHKKGLIG